MPAGQVLSRTFQKNFDAPRSIKSIFRRTNSWELIFLLSVNNNSLSEKRKLEKE